MMELYHKNMSEKSVSVNLFSPHHIQAGKQLILHKENRNRFCVFPHP